MLRDAIRLILVWTVFILLFVLAGNYLFAEDTTPSLDGTLVRIGGPKDANGVPVVEVEDFRDLPHDYAKRLPPELYYWWALAHNQRQVARTPAPSHGVLQIDENHSIIGTTPSFRRPGLGVGVRSGSNRVNVNGRNRTTIRYFPPQTGSGPAIIYNPYFR